MGEPAETSRLILILHAVAAVLLSLWLAIVVMWPALAGGGASDGLARDIEALCGQYFCHRMPQRSLAIGGEQLLVCARCTGVIAGYMLGAVAAVCGAEKLALWRVPWAIVMIALMGLSWLFGWLGWLQASWHWERVVAGALGGAGGYILISRCIVLLMNWWLRRQTRVLKGATT